MIRALLRTRAGRALIIADSIAAIVCAFLPLADHLSFEFAAVLTVVNAVVAPFVGFAAMRFDAAGPADTRRPARAAANAGLFAVAALVVPVLLILLNALRRPICEPVAGGLWMLLLPAPTAWLGATLGALVRQHVPRPWLAVGTVALVELVSIVTTGAMAYWGPVVFGFDHFFGYVPGPLYDETIPITTTLVSFRLATVFWGVAAVTAAGMRTPGDAAIRRMHARWCAALTIALVVTSVQWGSALGWRTTDRALAKAVAGEIHVDHLVIHYPRDWTDRAIDELVRDATFDAAQLEQAFGITPTHPIHIWMYPDPEAKRQLVGAGGTSFAKPYRHEIHIHWSGYPHVPLRHELVHAIAGEFATGPWLTPGGLLPQDVLVEGFAEAYDIDDDILTLPQRARAMRDLHIQPDLNRLLSINGFLGEASGRAYGYSGAFIRYLAQRFGTPAMRTLYRTGELSTLGPPATLIRDFERMLDTVHVDADQRSGAQRRYAQPSIFKRRCPREIGPLADSAAAFASDRRWDESLAMFDNLCALQPDDPTWLWRKLNIAVRMREPDAARVLAIAAALWAHPRLDPSLEATSRQLIGDEMWRRGDSAAANAEYHRAAALAVDPNTRPGLTMRLRALREPWLTEPYRARLVDGEPATAFLLRLLDALPSRRNDGLLLYLIGQQMRLSAPDRAADYMERADAAGIGDVTLTRENLRYLVQTRASRNRCDEAERARVRLAAAGGSAVHDAVAADWVARCRFAVARGWKPLPPL